MPQTSMQKPRKAKTKTPHPNHLYEAAVQDAELVLDFAVRVFRTLRGRAFTRLREDFCATAQVACAWAMRAEHHEAWGVDIDPEILEWARIHRLEPMEHRSRQVHLIEASVLEVTRPKVDMIMAMNFSYAVFKERKVLLAYFTAARKSLRAGGVLLLDAFCGPEMMCKTVEPREVDGRKDMHGREIPPFLYTWEHADFNHIDHHITCHIHFELPGKKPLKRAFTYDWRLWSLPELRDLLHDAGFKQVDVYTDQWSDELNAADGVMRKRKRLTCFGSFIPYIVATD